MVQTAPVVDTLGRDRRRASAARAHGARVSRRDRAERLDDHETERLRGVLSDALERRRLPTPDR
jgi:hypothetical protein